MQPAASAGATLAAIWLSGQFHGVMNAQTPIGSYSMRLVPTSSANSNASSALAVAMKWPMPDGAWARLASERRRAHLAADRGGDVAHARLVDLDDPAEQGEAIFTRRLREGVERSLRGGDGGVDIGLVTQGDGADDLLGCRVDDVERGAGRRARPTGR